MNPSRPAHIAGIVFDRGFPIDELFNEVVSELQARHVKLAGVIQTGGMEPGCDVLSVKLKSLAGDWEMPILQDRGREARGCRLDYASITEVSRRIAAGIPADADFVLLNRFGRAESEGNGFRDILAKCLAEGFKAITGVREDYADAWDAFHGGLAERLPPEKQAILDWCEAHLDRRRASAADGATDETLPR